MNKTLIAAISLICLFGSCNYEKYRYSFFEGNWVLINFLDTVQKYRSVVKADSLHMQEIYMKRYVDTIYLIEDGMKVSTFPYHTETSNKVKVASFVQGKPMEFFMNEYAYYLSYKSDGRDYVFVRADDLLIDSSLLSVPSSTERVINSLVLGGIYKQEGHADPVQFFTDGHIKGLAGFEYYKVCTGGDCRNFYPGDAVWMGNKNSGAWFTWAWEGKVLSIYKLVPDHLTGKKPVYRKGERMFILVKLK